MANRTTNINGNPIKLVDNSDDTFSFSVVLNDSKIATQTTLAGVLTQINSLLEQMKGNGDAGDAAPVSIAGKVIVASGKKTDADTTDRTISTTGFNHVAIINDGPAELVLAIDESALIGTKRIYVGDSEGFEDDIVGTVLHYTIVNDSCAFRYVLM